MSAGTIEQNLAKIAAGVEKIARELELLRKDANEEIKEWEKL